MPKPYETTGRILSIGPIENKGKDGTFRVRALILEIDRAGKYPQPIQIDAVQDDVDELDSYRAGDDVDVNFWLRGNEFKGRYYTNLKLADIRPAGGQKRDPEPELDDFDRAQKRHEEERRRQKDAPQPAPELEKEEQEDIPF